MPISINALLNKPTREEKFRKQQAAQDQVDKISTMNRADEIVRGQMEYARQLGIDFDEKAADIALRRAVADIEAAENPATSAAEKAARKARSASTLKSANEADAAKSEGLLKLPGARARLESTALDVKQNMLNNDNLTEQAKQPFAYDLGAAQSRGMLANLAAGAARDNNSLALADQTKAAEAARLGQQLAEAREFEANAPLRKLGADINIQKAQGLQGFLSQIAGNDLYKAAVYGGIQPGDLMGRSQFGVPAFPLPSGKAQASTGMLNPAAAAALSPEAEAQRQNEALLKALEKLRKSQNVPQID